MTNKEAIKTLKETRAGLYNGVGNKPTIYACALDEGIKALEERAEIIKLIDNSFYAKGLINAADMYEDMRNEKLDDIAEKLAEYNNLLYEICEVLGITENDDLY